MVIIALIIHLHAGRVCLALKLLLAGSRNLSPNKSLKEGCWECYRKYKEQNSFYYFLSMQHNNRGHLAVVAFNDCHKVMAAR